MTLTADQILALAPDPASAAAGRKLAAPRTWQGLGRSEVALWGECQGSALYQVRVDLQDLTTRCSCPSRKFPCKHALGLLLLAAGSPDALPQIEQPAWVSEWLAKRAGAAQARQTRQSQPPADIEVTPRTKRAEKRLVLVRQGIEGLDLWLADLIRNGLAGLELQPVSFWEKQAARLVDAQAPGLAARVRRLASIPNASPNWPERLLGALGRLALLTEAFGRFDTLDPALQADIRGLIGWSLKEDEVLAHGDLQRDTWLVIGQWIEEEDRGRAQRTWMIGRHSGRGALLLQFSFAGAPFAPAPVPGTAIDATLAFWPGAYPQRALVHARHGAPAPLTSFFDPARMSLPATPQVSAARFDDAGAHTRPQSPMEPGSATRADEIPGSSRTSSSCVHPTAVGVRCHDTAVSGSPTAVSGPGAISDKSPMASASSAPADEIHPPPDVPSPCLCASVVNVPPVGNTEIDAFLAEVAHALARQPWLERFPCLLRGIIPLPAADPPWQIGDGAGAALPLIAGEHWRLLALSGGHPVDLAAEWDGAALRPLGVIAEGAYYPLWEAR